MSFSFRPRRRSGYPPGHNFPEGQTKVSYEAKDKSGNRASCDIVVNVKGMSFFLSHYTTELYLVYHLYHPRAIFIE